MTDIIREHRDAILEIAARHGATNVRVFGSVARGEETASSDVDLLVDFEPGRSYFDLFRLERELGALLGREVDVLTEVELRPRVRARVMPEARAV